MSACDTCLRRGHLVGLLAPRVSGLLGRPGRSRRALLTLDDEALIELLCAPGPEMGAARAFLERFDPAAARERLAAHGTSALCRHASAYPDGLARLHDPPPVLFVAGGLDRLAAITSGPCVTVVGSRDASSYGLGMARRIGEALAEVGVGVVSGLALGIDAAAHLGACDADSSRALAVIARGPEQVYPQSHAELYDRIRAAGCVVSELPPGTGVHRWAFPARNRIMAALAQLTVVVEAGEPSGSLITATFALDLHREVGAVPGRATAKQARGANHLIRDGARMILGPDDVFDALRDLGCEVAAPRAAAAAPDLEEPLASVLSAVERCDSHHELTAACGLPAGALRAALTRLELLGLVRRDALGGYVRTAT